MNMLKRIAIVVGYVLLIAAIIAVIVFAHLGAQQHRSTQQVTLFSINIDGAEGHSLIDEAAMHRWFKFHDVHPEGRTIEDVDLATLENVAMQHSAVAAANAFITHDGYIEMSIVQREPIMRLKVDGYDHYVARDGHVFKSTNGYAAYVPVVTGGYKPHFGNEYVGDIRELVLDSISAMHRHINDLEQMKFAIYRESKRAKERMKSVRDSVVQKSWFMSQEREESLEEALKLYKEAYEHRYNDEEGVRQKNIAQLEKRQERIYNTINALRKRETDFQGLIQLVEYVLSNAFWSAEITQVVVSESGSGDMLIKLVPRSGDFTIDFGEVTNIDTKFHSLERFYHSVLSSVGWDAYTTISVRYDGQVVCRESAKRNEPDED